MSFYCGDFRKNDLVECKFSTNDAAGQSASRTTPGTVAVYKDALTVPDTAGVTDVANFSAIIGIHHVTINTAGAFYVPGSEYQIVLTGAQVAGISPVVSVIGHFSIEHRKADVDKFLGTTLVESSGGRIAGNFDFFYDNADAQTTTTLDNAGLTQQEVADSMRLLPTGTVNANSVDDKLDTLLTFDQEQQAVETTRTSDVVTTGTQTGTSANTITQDNVEWLLTSVAGGIDAELVFNIGTGSGENPSTMRLWGHFESGKNRVLQIQAYNFTVGGYENLGDVLSDAPSNYEILRGLGRGYVRDGVGPGVDGDVRLRFLYDATTSGKLQAGDDLHMDKVSVFSSMASLTTGEIVSSLLKANPNQNYPSSAIVIDLENGQPGSEFGLNGTPGNPVNNLTDALLLIESSGFAEFDLRGASALTLTSALPDWVFRLAPAASIDLNGQDVDDSTFIGGTLTGTSIAAAAGVRCHGVLLNGVTSWGSFQDCRLPIASSLVANGAVVNLIDCESVRPGAANPSVSGANVSALSLSITKYGGGIDVLGLDNAANVTVSGRGSVSFTDAASTATAIVSGNMRLTGAIPTGLVLTDLARVDQLQVQEVILSDATPFDGANVDVTISSRAAPADAMNLVANAITATAIDTTGGNKIADMAWRRQLANVAASTFGDAVIFRSPLGAVRKLVNRLRSAVGVLEIYDETDTGTPAGTQTLTTNASADPIVEADTV